MMRKQSMMSIWIDVLRNSDIERPFTTRQAYEIIIASAPKRGTRRKKVPAGTNELSKRLKLCSEVVRVNPKCNTRKPIALWDFVD